MEEGLRNTPVKKFERPEGIIEREICDASGLLATPDCPRVRREVFVKGTEPTRRDNTYQPVVIDAATGLLWADGCRGPQVKRVYRIYPPDAQDWATKQGLQQAPEVDCFGRATEMGQPMRVEGAVQNGVRETDSVGGQPAANPGAQGGSTQALVIVSPAQNGEFETSPQLPSEMQQVEIAARLNRAVSLHQVQLLVDGVVVGTCTSAPYRVLWPLTPGLHHVQAVGITSDGETVASEPVQFQVRAPGP
jgi:hypothetical protein